MKKHILVAGMVVSLVVAGVLASPSKAFAVKPVQDTVCFCHNINNNPETICTDNSGLINGHQGHIESGMDTLGSCAAPSPTNTPTPTPVEPSVPEFGLISGVLALAASFGSYSFLKRKQN